MKIGRLAKCYRWIEYAAFGKELERRRFAFLGRLGLDQMRPVHRILILGEGDGRALARILQIAPTATIHVVEISPEMIALAKRRIGNSERVEFFCTDARTVQWPEASYDAIFTFFFLDCFTSDDARCLIQRLCASLAPNGIWLHSDFAIPARGWHRLHARLWIRVMYLFFRAATGLRVQALPPVEKLFTVAGLHRETQEQKWGGMIISEVWRRR